MALFRDDIKLLESERLTDDADGGGRMTGNEVVDGQANNLFPDISSLDRTTGRVNLRKAYPAVLSPNTDRYYGAHVIISDMPDDPNVFATLFSTGSQTDERSDAADRVESFVVEGPRLNAWPFGTQVEGQKQITIYQRLDTPLPGNGEALLLENDSAGLRQFVRIRDVSDEVASFEDEEGVFKRRLVTLDIGVALEHTFDGQGVERETQQADQSPTRIRSTNVADAARYYSTTPVAEALNHGDLTLPVERVFVPLVPSTTAEDPVTDAALIPGATITVTSGGQDIEVPTTAYTDRIDISTVANRQFNYTRSLVPIPQPGTVGVSYRAQGNWQTVRDENGDGTLTGTGSGTVDYSTGTVQLTVAELPDVPSQIIFQFAEPARYADRSGDEPDIELPEVVEDFNSIGAAANDSWVRGSVTLEWFSDGAAQTETDDGAGKFGTVGRISYWLGKVWFRPSLSNLPDPGSDLTVSADTDVGVSDTLTPTPDSNGDVTISRGETIVEGTLELEWDVQRRTETKTEFRTGENQQGTETETETNRVTYVVNDDGVGGLQVVSADGGADSVPGSVDYSTGDITVRVQAPYTETSSRRSYDDFAEGETIAKEEAFEGAVAVRYHNDVSGASSGWSETIPVGTLKIDLLPLRSGEVIVPGSVRFQFNNVTYADRDGDIVRDPGQSTSPVSGSIDYVRGIVTLTYWETGTDGLSLDTLVTIAEGVGEGQLAGRTSSAPLRVGSFDLQVTSAAGELITAFANNDGDLFEDTDNPETGRVRGNVNWDTGVYEVEFGQWNSGTFELRNGDGDLITPVLPFTARYNTVAFSFIPLDPDILGLDPVRLPQDGRVPFFRPGNVAVIHHTQTTDIGDGSQTTLRDHVAFIHVFDADGTQVDESDLSVDLAAGTVEVTNATPYVTPFSARDRIEQMRLVAEVQISGFVVVDRAITRDFPADARISSALLYGDLEARALNVFEQSTWTSEWSDELIGDAPDASFNDTDFPIAVTNEGAIEERWVMVFQSTTEVDVIGETIGQILTGAPISNPIAPTNPVSDAPYFTIDPDAWGSGWATGNCVRFNTKGANAPLWIARTILAGEETAGDDEFTIQVRGDAQ